MTKNDLVKHYERNLEKVKCMHNPDRYTSELEKEQCNAYIEQAKKDLEAVKNGREW